MSSKQKQKSIYALQATNFFLADVQTGLGPFLAAYLAGAGWNPGRVGVVLTLGGIVTVVLQTPAGAFVDRVQSKRMVLVVGSIALGAGALLLFSSIQPLVVYGSQILIGGAAPFLAPTLAAITMGLVGHRFFDFQFGKNQAWNSAGNVACALVIAIISQVFGNRAIFMTAAVLTVPTILSVLSIKGDEINYVLARGGCEKPDTVCDERASTFRALAGDRGAPRFLALRVFLPFRKRGHASPTW